LKPLRFRGKNSAPGNDIFLPLKPLNLDKNYPLKPLILIKIHP